MRSNDGSEREEATMTDATVEFVHLEKRYGRVRALDGVTCDVVPSVTGLLGPNGAGKTTLMRIAATVLAPDRGTIRLLGRDPASAADRVEIRRRLGYMPQEPGFYRSFTTFAFVDYVAILKEMTDRAIRHDEVRRVLAAVGLEDVANRKVKALSGGMRRRLALAQALLGNPELLVLDEPTAGLDPEQRLRFREVVSQLPGRPTVLLSTHQTEDVTALCERVIVLAGGEVRFDGTPAALAATAGGRVWIGDVKDDGALIAWRMGDGRYRHVGDPPPGASAVDPTIDDAYLLMVGAAPAREGAAA
jgi:ABC-2 type transport system ATP-binding protein